MNICLHSEHGPWAPVLRWGPAGTDEPRDSVADSAGLVEHGYWQCGPQGDGSWCLTLIEQDAALDELRSWEWSAAKEEDARTIAEMLETAGITADEIDQLGEQ